MIRLRKKVFVRKYGDLHPFTVPVSVLDPVPVSTIQVKSANLTMRMRRFSHLTNAFSEKLENYLYLGSLYFAHYNFVRIHKTLKLTPAMETWVSDKVHDRARIVGLIDVNENEDSN